MYSFLNPESRPEPVSAQELTELEERFDLHLPEALKDYYMKYNCQTIKPVCLRAGQETFEVYGMLPLFSGPMSVDHILEICQTSNLFGKGCFPFAISAEGDDFVYDTFTKNIYFVRLDDLHHRQKICTGIDHFFYLLNQTAQNS
ncbi:SMI1/KNR4 family protein [Erysipelotrichaceae bacterium 51-3]